MAETITPPPPPPLHSTHTNSFGQINISFFNMTHCFSQGQQRNSTSYHAVLAFIVPALLNFLQIKYQRKDKSPFDMHPKSVRVAIASLLLYCFAYYEAELRSLADRRQQTCACIARCGMVLFGWLAVVSMASILLPDSVGLLLCFLYMLFCAGEFLRRQLQTLWKWLHGIIMGGRVPLMLPSPFTAHAFSNTAAIHRPQVQIN